MDNNLRNRIICALIIGLVMFMTETILAKLVFPRDDWLIHSVIWATNYSVGYLLCKAINDDNKKIWEVFLFETYIIVIFLILAAFVLGVILNMDAWKKYTSDMVFPFALSLITFNKWKKE